MNDTPDFLRKQMQETKAQLSEKLESLEQQFSDAIQSTGTAVNSTIQAVEQATHTLSNALDIRRQIDRHPWLVLGGAILVGERAEKFEFGRGRDKQFCTRLRRKRCESEKRDAHSWVH